MTSQKNIDQRMLALEKREELLLMREKALRQNTGFDCEGCGAHARHMTPLCPDCWRLLPELRKP